VSGVRDGWNRDKTSLILGSETFVWVPGRSGDTEMAMERLQLLGLPFRLCNAACALNGPKGMDLNRMSTFTIDTHGVMAVPISCRPAWLRSGHWHR
jgi:hypothetical protein